MRSPSMEIMAEISRSLLNSNELKGNKLKSFGMYFATQVIKISLSRTIQDEWPILHYSFQNLDPLDSLENLLNKRLNVQWVLGFTEDLDELIVGEKEEPVRKGERESDKTRYYGPKEDYRGGRKLFACPCMW